MNSESSIDDALAALGAAKDFAAFAASYGAVRRLLARDAAHQPRRRRTAADTRLLEAIRQEADPLAFLKRRAFAMAGARLIHPTALVPYRTPFGALRHHLRHLGYARTYALVRQTLRTRF